MFNYARGVHRSVTTPRHQSQPEFNMTVHVEGDKIKSVLGERR